MELLAVFSPFIAFLIAGLFGKTIGHKGCQIVTCVGVIIAALSSVVLFFDVIFTKNMVDGAYTTVLMRWINSGDFSVSWALRIDQLTVVMMCVVNIVSACVHVYSVGYMSHDASRGRFMAYLSLFTFAMLMLVTSNNLIQLFFGWEGVGVASYLLIGFWNHKHSANAAAQKAFIVNRVGDFGLALGIMATFVVFGSVEFQTIFDNTAQKADATISFLGMELHALTVICLLLFVGAVGKSAQLGLHTWLPDAMEGPTPVSALIHAATMVTAGVFLVARFSPLYEYAPDALMVVTIVGALTAFVAATIGMTQFDIKRVIAYSTMSQLGYMFFALGVSAYGAAIFHLMTHAFFKALLFLGAGSVIHAMSDEQDMRNMGGIWKKIPVTYAMMWIGSLALAGVWPFAGYFSKDMILESAWASGSWQGHFAFWMGICAAFMTAFYSWRLLIMTFHGKPRASAKVMGHVHESPGVMISPLIVLSLGALFAGSLFYGGFVGSSSHHGEEHAAVIHDAIDSKNDPITEDIEVATEDKHTDIAEENADEPVMSAEEEEALRESRNTETPLVSGFDDLEQDVTEIENKVGKATEKALDQVVNAKQTLKEIVKTAGESNIHVWSREYFWHKSIFVLPENDSVEAAHSVPKWVKIMPALAGFSGILLAYLFYMFFPSAPGVVVRIFKPVYIVFFKKWFFDEIYNAVFVKNTKRLGKFFWIQGDKNLIDGFGPDGVSNLSVRFSSALGRFQSGYVYHYVFMMIIALIAIVSWFVLSADPGFYNLSAVQEIAR